MTRMVLGIDLGGAVTKSTGFALLASNGKKPKLVELGVLPRAKTPEEGEATLVERIEGQPVCVLAVDAPLNLPPCMVCNRCSAASPEECREDEARRVWGLGGHPLTQRLCEKELNGEFDGTRPQRTMGLGLITARGVALKRRFDSNGFDPMPGTLIEVYPYGTLRRLGWQTKKLGQSAEAFRRSVLKKLRSEMDLGSANVDSMHEVDALTAAYTAWLHSRGETSNEPADWPEEAGWITLPLEAGAQVNF